MSRANCHMAGSHLDHRRNGALPPPDEGTWAFPEATGPRLYGTTATLCRTRFPKSTCTKT